jgi:hypothetical protein
MQALLQRMYIKLLMAFKYNQVMPVALMIAEKQILTMSGINIFPVFQS